MLERTIQVIGLLGLLLGVGCQAMRPAADPSSRLDQLAAQLTGSFSSTAQAEADSTYFDIRLQAAPIWTERSDGPWLYVEQAAASALSRPYRQRVYHLSARADGTLVSAVYELPGQALAYAGAWQTPTQFNTLEPSQLVERTGCAVLLRPDQQDRFIGATHEDDCQSSLRGATYATSEVEIGPEGMTSWDRGYAADGTQVWGAVTGPYRFDRIDG
ncbi:MAG: chromophore lyase CpcT/CpeT [Bacteroidota bacterium]